jgi:putative signal transducing protein
VDGDDLVFLTTAADPIEADAIRDFLAGHQVSCHVQGDRHDSLLGGSGVPELVDLQLMVFRRDLARAEELLDAFDADVEGEAEPIGGEPTRAPLAWIPAGPMVAPPPAPKRPPRRRNPRTAALMALVPSFGAGHLYARGWIMGGLLALIQIAGVLLLPTALVAGLAVIGLSILIDLIGAPAAARQLNEGLEREVGRLSDGG